MRGSPFLVALLVKKDSPIKSVHDVKGKRMTGEYPAHLAVWYNMFGHLASAGLTWSDVRVVPVPAVNEGVDALVQGRADVTEFSLERRKVKEADAAVGVRHVSIDCSARGREAPARRGARLLPAAGQGRHRHRRPRGHLRHGLRPLRGAGKSVPDAVVEAVRAGSGRAWTELKPIHPCSTSGRAIARSTRMRPFPIIRARCASTRSAAPGHPAMEQAQQKLLTP